MAVERDTVASRVFMNVCCDLLESHQMKEAVVACVGDTNRDQAQEKAETLRCKGVWAVRPANMRQSNMRLHQYPFL